MKVFTKLVAPAVAALLAVPAAAQVDYQGSYPWSLTANGGPDAAVPGWWYNLGITGLRVELMPSAKKHLLVRYVFPGSPAAGVVAVGDVLTGAGGSRFVEAHQDGYGPDVFGARGPIGEFAIALEAAQDPAGSGELALTLERSGVARRSDSTPRAFPTPTGRRRWAWALPRQP